MTNAVAKPKNFGLARWETRRNVPVVLALKKPGRQLPAVSVHAPVTPENRSRSRVMREAELAAWNATGHIERTRTEEKERRDLRAFGLIATLALTTVTISLLKSASVAAGWAGFVNFVHRLLG